MIETPIGRRGMFGLAAALALPMPEALALPVPGGNRLSFDIYRNGGKIGEQRLVFSRTGDALTVDNHVDLHVSLLAIPVFHYSAHIVEHWRKGAFRKATSEVDNDGTKISLLVAREANGVAISGNRIKRHVAPANALPLTYWNKAMLKGPMINMQTGHADTPSIAKEGWFKLPAEPSGSVTAEQYKLTGPIRLSIYYDQADTWSGLAFHHKGHITYRPVLG